MNVPALDDFIPNLFDERSFKICHKVKWGQLTVLRACWDVLDQIRWILFPMKFPRIAAALLWICIEFLGLESNCLVT